MNLWEICKKKYGFYREAILLSEMANNEHEGIFEFEHISKRKTINLFNKSLNSNEANLKFENLLVKDVFARLEKFHKKLKSNLGLKWAIKYFNSFILMRFVFKCFIPIYILGMDINNIIEVNLTKIIIASYLDVFSYTRDILKTKYGMNSSKASVSKQIRGVWWKLNWDSTYYCKTINLKREFILFEVQDIMNKTRELKHITGRFPDILKSLQNVRADYWKNHEDILKTIKHEAKSLYENKCLKKLFFDSFKAFCLNIVAISSTYNRSPETKDKFEEVLDNWKKLEASFYIFNESLLEINFLGQIPPKRKSIYVKQKHVHISRSCIAALKLIRTKTENIIAYLDTCNRILEMFIDKKIPEQMVLEPFDVPERVEDSILILLRLAYTSLERVLPKLDSFIDDANAELKYNLELKNLKNVQIDIDSHANIDKKYIAMPLRIIHAFKTSNLIMLKPNQEVFNSSCGKIYICEEYIKCFIKKMVKFHNLSEINERISLMLGIKKLFRKDFERYFQKQKLDSLFNSICDEFLSQIPEERSEIIEVSVQDLRINKLKILENCECFDVETPTGVIDCFNNKFEFDCTPVYTNVALRTMLSVFVMEDGLTEKILEMKSEIMIYMLKDTADFGYNNVHDSLVHLDLLKSSASNSIESLQILHRLTGVISLYPEAVNATSNHEIFNTIQDIHNSPYVNHVEELFHLIGGFIRSLSCFIVFIWLLKPPEKVIQRILTYHMPRVYNPFQRIYYATSNMMQLLGSIQIEENIQFYEAIKPIDFNNVIEGIYKDDIRNKLNLLNDELLDEADFVVKKVVNIKGLLEFEDHRIDPTMYSVKNFIVRRMKLRQESSDQSGQFNDVVVAKRVIYIQRVHKVLNQNIYKLLDMHTSNNSLSIFNYIENRVNYITDLLPKLSKFEKSLKNLSIMLDLMYRKVHDLTFYEYIAIFSKEMHQFEFIAEKITFDLKEIIIIGQREIKSMSINRKPGNLNISTYVNDRSTPKDHLDTSGKHNFKEPFPRKSKDKNCEKIDSDTETMGMSPSKEKRKPSAKNREEISWSDKCYKLSDFTERDDYAVPGFSGIVLEEKIANRQLIVCFLNSLVDLIKTFKRIISPMDICNNLFDSVINRPLGYVAKEINITANNDHVYMLDSILSKIKIADGKINEVHKKLLCREYLDTLSSQTSHIKYIDECGTTFIARSSNFLNVTDNFQKKSKYFLIFVEFLDVENETVKRIFNEFFVGIKSDLDRLCELLNKMEIPDFKKEKK